jgi:hypothetical protein
MRSRESAEDFSPAHDRGFEQSSTSKGKPPNGLLHPHDDVLLFVQLDDNLVSQQIRPNSM